jgi:serine protease Do
MLYKFSATMVVAAALGVAAVSAEDSNLRVARQLNDAFAQVAESVSPSVVVINVIQKLPSVEQEEKSDTAFEHLPPGSRRRFNERFDRVPRPMRGQGSGVILHKDGYILTNRHVIEDAETIEVRMLDGRRFKAKIRGVDPQSDVAVIQVDSADLPVARIGDSDKLRVGEFAIAIGAPFNLDYTVTFGHISAKSRGNVILGSEGANMDQDFIQTDANINPGNSGGPLVNINGEVIGINTMIHSLQSGIGFAIPSNLAVEVANKLISDGKFTRSWLGIGIRDLREEPDRFDRAGAPVKGVLVANVMPEGPAAGSELRAGDIITAVAGKPVHTPQQLRAEIRGKKPGAPVQLEINRAGKLMKIQVSPQEYVLETASARTQAEPRDP